MKTINHYEVIQELTLMDDVFMTKIFEDNIECTELVINIILNKKLKVKSVKTQYTVKNLQGRGVRLDIHAESEDGKQFNIEIQRQNKGAGEKRARYNSSILDANSLISGEDFNKLPDTYVIFITENDVFKHNKPIYLIERTIIGEGELFNDGSHIIYVNNKIQDDTPLGKLMHDFKCKSPEQMNYEILAERIKYFKETEGGSDKMSTFVEDLVAKYYQKEINEARIAALSEGLVEGTAKGVVEGRAKGLAEGLVEGHNKGLAEGRDNERRRMAIDLINSGKLTLEDIAAFTKLSLNEVNELANGNPS